MFKPNKLLLFFSLLALPCLVFAEESMTITTYYPSPYGSYNELTTAGNTYLATNSGNVGIGTTSPGTTLEINAGASGDTPDLLVNGGTRAALELKTTTASSNGYSYIQLNQPAYDWEIGASDSNGNFYINNALFQGNANSELAITTGGNVGIGTTGPITKLQVGAFAFTGGDLPSIGAITTNINSASATTNADTGYQLTLTETSTVGANKGGGIAFQAVYDGSNNINTIAGIKGLRTNATVNDLSGYLSFLTRGASGSNTERIRIDSSGNVGIGTTAPALNTSGKVLHIHESSTGASAIHFTNNTTGAGAANGFIIGRWADGGYGNGILLWNYASTPITFATGSIERMYIDGTTGNVGIGTTGPSFGLDVRGTNAWIGSGDSSQSTGGWRLGRWPAQSANTWVYLSRADSTAYQDLAVGAVWAGGALQHGTSDDVAEMTPVKPEDNLEPGDVVVIAEPSDNRTLLAKSRAPYDSKIAGVISNPATAGLIIGGSHPTDVHRNDLKPLALSGRVITKVTTENGTIRVGDPLTSSSGPGIAMKATKSGWMLGRAMQSFGKTADKTEIGNIWVLISVGWYGGASE